MRNFIMLAHQGASYNHYLIDPDDIDYVSDLDGDNVGAIVFLKGKELPLTVAETASQILPLLCQQA